MKSERGFTLIEVLAALSLSGIVVAIIISVYALFARETTVTLQKQADDTSTHLALSVLQDRLLGSESVTYLQNGKSSQLRFSKNSTEQSIYYKDQTLSICDVNGDQLNTCIPISENMREMPLYQKFSQETQGYAQLENNETVSGNELIKLSLFKNRDQSFSVTVKLLEGARNRR